MPRIYTFSINNFFHARTRQEKKGLAARIRCALTGEFVHPGDRLCVALVESKWRIAKAENMNGQGLRTAEPTLELVESIIMKKSPKLRRELPAITCR